MFRHLDAYQAEEVFQGLTHDPFRSHAPGRAMAVWLAIPF